MSATGRAPQRLGRPTSTPLTGSAWQQRRPHRAASGLRQEARQVPAAKRTSRRTTTSQATERADMAERTDESRASRADADQRPAEPLCVRLRPLLDPGSTRRPRSCQRGNRHPSPPPARPPRPAATPTCTTSFALAKPRRPRSRPKRHLQCPPGRLRQPQRDHPVHLRPTSPSISVRPAPRPV